MPPLTLLWASVPKCLAAVALPRPAGGATISSLLGRIINFLQGSIVVVCIAIFAAGGLMIILAAGRDDMIQKGKTMMIGSIIGLVIVLGAGTLIRLLFFGLS